jgi:hypothetical protein
MSARIKRAINDWRNIRVVNDQDDLNHVCSTADAITDWCLEKAPTITAVDNYKELLLRHFRRGDVKPGDLETAYDLSLGACSKIERVLKKHLSQAIPSEHRTQPMTLKRGATLLGLTKHHGDRNAVEIFSGMITDGIITAEKFNRQTYVFDRRQFPTERTPRISP